MMVPTGKVSSEEHYITDKNIWILKNTYHLHSNPGELVKIDPICPKIILVRNIILIHKS